MEEAGKVHEIRLHAVLCALEKNRTRPLNAVELAAHAGLHYAHETNRRRVRELVAELRETGQRICAGWMPGSDEGGAADTAVAHGEGALGYWLARDDAEWKAYQESKRAAARFAFVRIRLMATAANEAQSGQGRLIEDRSREWATQR